MDSAVITVADLIQIALLIGACYACYIKGKVNGVVDLANMLLERGKISLKDLEELQDLE